MYRDHQLYLNAISRRVLKVNLPAIRIIKRYLQKTTALEFKEEVKGLQISVSYGESSKTYLNVSSKEETLLRPNSRDF